MGENDPLKLKHSLNVGNLPSINEKPCFVEVSNIVKLVDNLTGYVRDISKFLDFNLIVDECKKHKIKTVALDHKSCCRNYFAIENVDEWSVLITIDSRIDGYKYTICLNPFLDREDTAYQLTNILQIKVSPAEIYYPIFFHEIGHIILKHKDIECLYFFNQCSQDEFRKIYLKQEKAAWEYAMNRFFNWKKRFTKVSKLQIPPFAACTTNCRPDNYGL